MAYVVARRGGRFEVRESFHTASGPRSRTLVGFEVLTDEALEAASQRAQRPFDADAVLRSARRAGARVRLGSFGGDRARDRFFSGSKRMARTLAALPPDHAGVDPGTALTELLGFADMVRASQPRRPFEPLAFPALARLAKNRAGTATT